MEALILNNESEYRDLSKRYSFFLLLNPILVVSKYILRAFEIEMKNEQFLVKNKMIYKSKWIVFSFSCPRESWANLSDDVVKNYILWLRSNRFIQAHFFSFDFINELVLVHLKIQYRRPAILKHLEKVFLAKFSYFLFDDRNYQAFPAISSFLRREPKTSTVALIENSFKIHLAQSLFELTMTYFANKTPTIENVLFFLIHLQLTWIKARIEVSGTSVSTILYKGYGGLVWARGINERNDDQDAYKLFNHHISQLRSIYHDVFDHSLNSLTSDSEGLNWSSSCKKYLNNCNTFFHGNGVFEEMSFYYIPKLLNEYLIKDHLLSTIIFYSVNRLLNESEFIEE